MRVEAEITDRLVEGEVLAMLDQLELKQQTSRVVEEIYQLQSGIASAEPGQRPALEREASELNSQLQDLESKIAEGIIRAPFDCIVLGRRIDQQAMVAPAHVAFEVVADSPPIVTGSLPRDVIVQLDTQHPVEVTIGDTVFNCRLTKGPAAATGGGRHDFVNAEFASPVARKYWLFDEVAEARLQIRPSAADGYWLPISALRRLSGGRWSALAAVSRGNEVELVARAIDVLRVQGHSVLVSGEIQGSDQIVVRGGHRVVPGQAVVVSQASTAEIDGGPVR